MYLGQYPVVVDRTEVEDAIKRVAAELAEAVKIKRWENLLMVPVLTGGMFFAADLIREMGQRGVLGMEVAPIVASSYGKAQTSTRDVIIQYDGTKEQAVGKICLIVDDILDTGLTPAKVHQQLLKNGARYIRTVVLFEKPRRCRLAGGVYRADFAGLQIGAEFVFGCGLDLEGKFRELDFLAKVQ